VDAKRFFAACTLFIGVFYVALPLIFSHSPYVVGVFINAAVLAVISSGVWVTFAIGRINIAQGAFAMIGGYVTGILATRYGISFWLCLPLSGIAAALAGMAIGPAILRLKGVYFSMISLSLTEVVRLVALTWDGMTNGASGILDIPRPQALKIGGLTLIPAFDGDSPLPYYFLAVSLLAASLLLLWRTQRCRVGWIFNALRLNDELAASMGVNVARYRVLAFAVSCFLGGIGGSFFAAFHQNIYPATYSVTDSINFMLYCFLGGLDFITGALVGTFVLTISFELLHSVQKYQTLIYAGIMILAMMLLPNGLLSLRWPRREPPAPPAAEATP
jgi:branched-chain amino acid transport system permease protein